MKTRRLTMLIAALTMTIGLSAETVNDENTASQSTAAATETIKDGKIEGDKVWGGNGSAVQIEYLGMEDYTAFGLSYLDKKTVFGADICLGETKGDVKTNNLWGAYIGWQDRYFLSPSFFVEGRVALGYYFFNYSYRTSDGYNNKGQEIFKVVDANDDYLALVATPRIGLRFGNCALTAGYRWDFYKLKFKKEYTSDYFTIGLTIGL